MSKRELCRESPAHPELKVTAMDRLPAKTGEVALALDIPRTASVRALTPAVVASCDRETFDKFLRPLFVALVQAVYRAAVDVSANLLDGAPLNPPLLLMLDEAGNIAPLQSLPKIAATGAGQGITLMTIWQDRAQIRELYRDAERTLISNHTTTVWLPGSQDLDTLKLLADLIGDQWVAASTISAAPDGGLSVSEGSERIDVAPPAFLRTLPHGTAVALSGNTPPALIRTHAYYQQHRWRRLVGPDALARHAAIHDGSGPTTAQRWTDEAKKRIRESRELADYYEAVAKGRDAKAAANWVINELTGRLNKEGKGIEDTPINAAQLGAVLDLIGEGTISGKIAKDLIDIVWIEGGDPRAIVEQRGLKQVTDTGAIEKVIDEIVARHPDKVADLKAKPQAIGWFVGQVMKATGGKANPQAVNELLKRRLAR